MLPTMTLLHERIDYELSRLCPGPPFSREGEGTRCLAIATESCLSSFLATHPCMGRVLYFSTLPVDRYPPVRHVKHVAPVYGMTILAKHWSSVGTIIIRDLDTMCAEYLLLLHLLRYWNRHLVLLVSPVSPPLEFLHAFFPRVVRISDFLLRPSHKIEYLVEGDEYGSMSFYVQRQRFEDWFLVYGSTYRRIVIFVTSRHQAEIIRLYFEVVHPVFSVFMTRDTLPVVVGGDDTPSVIISTGTGPVKDCHWEVDLVVEFGRFQQRFRSHYGDVQECPQVTMLRRQRVIGANGTVLRLMTEAQFESRPAFFSESIPEAWVPWSCLFLASLRLSYRHILRVTPGPVDDWRLAIEGSSKKRLKTLLQYPFSVRTHLMLERCRTFPVRDERHRTWVVLAITLINWFDRHHRFLLSKKSFYELQRIYGDEDELFIHMRIAVLVVSQSPLIHMDFYDAQATSKTFCFHFRKALRLVYAKPPSTVPPVMSDGERNTVRYFFMTDPRVERCHHPTTCWNTVSHFVSPKPYHGFLLLSTAPQVLLQETRATLWAFLPAGVTTFQHTLAKRLLDIQQQHCQKVIQKSLFHDRVVRYFNEVLVLAEWGSDICLP